MNYKIYRLHSMKLIRVDSDEMYDLINIKKNVMTLVKSVKLCIDYVMHSFHG